MSRASEILSTWEAMESHLSLWKPVWQDIADYIYPRKSNILKQTSPGQRQTDKMFDSTAFEANELLASSMQGSLTSASIPWFELRIPGLERGEDDAIDEWLDTCAALMHDALRQSNFQAESHELYSDLGAFGTGLMFEEPNPPRHRQRWTGIRFTAIPPGTFGLDEDAEGRVNVVYVKYRMSARAAVARWGAEAVGEQVRAAAQGRPEQQLEQFEFIHAVFPRENVPPLSLDEVLRGVPAKRMPWASVWVDVAGRKVVRESGFMEFPFMAPRWAKTTGEIYGRGPGYIALPDVKTLNKIKELKLKALAKMVNPPTVVRDDGVISAVDITAGGITYVRDMDAVQPLDLRIQLERVDLQEERLQASIRRIFFSDQLQLQDGPQMTATEVEVRFELMQRVLGPTLGRLEQEYLDPLVNRTFWIMFRAGVFPPMPEALRLFLNNGGRLDIKYEGPLARSQRLADVASMNRLLTFAAPLIQLDPEVADVLDFDEMVRQTAINVNAKARVIRSRDEVQARRAQRREQQALQAQMQQALAAAEGIGKAGPGLKAIAEAGFGGGMPAIPGSPV